MLLKYKLMQLTHKNKVLNSFTDLGKQMWSFFFDFYLSISEKWVIKLLKFAGNYTGVYAEDLSLIKAHVSQYFMNKESCCERRERMTTALFLMQRKDHLWVQNSVN